MRPLRGGRRRRTHAPTRARRHPDRARFLLAGGLVAVALIACTGSSAPERGILAGTWRPSPEREATVTLSWTATDPVHGVVHTTLGEGGEHFRGQYARVLERHGERTHVVVTAIHGEWLDERWSGRPWADADYVKIVEYPAFTRHYAGRVLATLEGDRGHHMRCRLLLDDPDAGLMAGGRGHCQVSDGGTIDVRF